MVLSISQNDPYWHNKLINFDIIPKYSNESKKTTLFGNYPEFTLSKPLLWNVFTSIENCASTSNGNFDIESFLSIKNTYFQKPIEKR
jgi:hypothetical protein